MDDLTRQVELGPRIPGSEAHAKTVKLIKAELEEAGWGVEEQAAEQLGHRLVNIVGKRPGSGTSGKPRIILGAHYDTRLLSDRDPNPTKRGQPGPGANDGASGVAVLLEMARTLPAELPVDVWLVFFDGEDNGNIAGWDWILGSRAFAESLQSQGKPLPDAIVIVDMIGDIDLNIYQEQNSDPEITDQIWQHADKLGYSSIFLPQAGRHILDDHIPFLELGIPAADIIDIDYQYWHTTLDTVDKVSTQSLQAVGDTLTAWLKAGAPLRGSE